MNRPELSEPFDVLAVGAHPDDLEIAIGGTLAKLVQQGYRVAMIDLTDGEPTPGSPKPEIRLQEAKTAAEILGVHVRKTLDLPNRKLFDCFESRVALAKEIRRLRPSIVMGIADKTPMASPDHWQAMQITDAAIFYSRLTKWDEVFDGLPVHTVQKQLWYPLGFQNLTIPRTSGCFVVDISTTLKRKVESVLAYKTQFQHREEHIVRLIESQTGMSGTSAGFEAGELFLNSTTLGVTDLVKTVLQQRK